MELSAGDKLGPYEILSQLGRGGMGEVYKARDSRLNRFVALKILRGDLVANDSRKQRFIQEAKAASALNHPNIVTIYDIFEEQGTDCLVLEYIAGKTLDALIPRQGMRLNEALRVAVQVAEGLRKAHAAGIIHRDIKPSNIIVSEDGTVKILDFGLAKLTEAAPPSADDATHTSGPDTEEGTVMGTTAYMSPEQAEGQKVDVRTDIFSFGALLHEMLTGRRAFAGTSKVAVLSAILKEEPAPPENIPADLKKILRRCLRKDREKRYQHMDDLKLALEEVREESESGSTTAVATPPASRKWLWASAAVAILAATSAAVWLWPKAEIRTPNRLTRLTFNAGLSTSPALSPDGKLLAYASDRATNGEHLDIWLQHLSGGEPVRLTKEDGSESEPNFSPDGSMIAYASSRGGIYTIPVLGGEPRQLSPRGSRPRFSPDGKWIAFHEKTSSAAESSHLFVIPATGGSARRIVPGFRSASFPVWSPDSKSILAVAYRSTTESTEWWLLPLNEGEPRPMGLRPILADADIRVSATEPAAWAGDSLIFTVRFPGRSQIMRMRLDQAAKLIGKPEPVTAGTALDEDASVTPDGRIAFASIQFSSELWMLPVDSNQAKVTGPLRRLTEDAALNSTAAISSDGSKISFVSNRDGKRGLWLLDLSNAKYRKLSPSSGELEAGATFPGITSDAGKVSYQFLESGQTPRYVVADLSAGSFQDHPGRGWGMSPSGRFLFFLSVGGNNDLPIKVMLSSTRESSELMSPKWPQRSPRLSLDERWITLHTLNSPATRQIWIMPFQFGHAATESEWIAVTDGKTLDRNPDWSPDGNTLYWLADRGGQRGIWAVKLNPTTKRPAGPAFEIKMFPGTRHSMMRFSNTAAIQPAVARDKIVFALGDETGNIWLTKLDPSAPSR